MTNNDRFDLSPASLALAGQILDVLSADFALQQGNRVVIGAAGESGSGKSVTASSLAHELAARGLRAQVIYQDDYFIRPPQTNHDYRLSDLSRVGPHEVRLDLIAEHIADFRAARDGVVAPHVNYPANRFDTQVMHFSDCDVLVVEGTYVLQLATLDVGLFFAATHEDTRARRRARNRDLDAPIIDEILAIEHRLIAPQAALADLIIDRDFVMHRQ